MLILPDLGKDFGVDEVNDAYRRAWRMLEIQGVDERQKGRIGQPEGITAFATPQVEGSERHHIRVRYAGYSGHRDSHHCNMLVEFDAKRASICFSAISMDGTSPTNAIEELSGIAYDRVARPRGYAPGQVEVFNHISSKVYAEWRQDESLQRLGLVSGKGQPVWSFNGAVFCSHVPSLLYNLPGMVTPKFMDFTQPQPPASPKARMAGLMQRLLRLGGGQQP